MGPPEEMVAVSAVVSVAAVADVAVGRPRSGFVELLAGWGSPSDGTGALPARPI